MNKKYVFRLKDELMNYFNNKENFEELEWIYKKCTWRSLTEKARWYLEYVKINYENLCIEDWWIIAEKRFKRCLNKVISILGNFK